jgi:uncharacterized membrane protein YqiK
MDKILELLTSPWAIGIFSLLFVMFTYKWILRVLCGMIIIPEDKIGLVTKKFVLFGANKSLPDGRIIALNGEAGYQADALAPGLYWGYWIWQYSIDFESFVSIPSGRLGLIVARDGKELPAGHILAKGVDCDNFQDARKFLENGGTKGKQSAYINTGTYRINTLLFEVTLTEITTVEEGQVGIITTLDGEPLERGQIAGHEVAGHNNFQNFDTFLEGKGQRGLQTQVVLVSGK